MPSPDLDKAVRTEVHREAQAGGWTPSLVVTDYVVIAAATGWNDQGQEVSQVVIIPSGVNHHIMGLLREATIRHDAYALAAYMDDDDTT